MSGFDLWRQPAAVACLGCALPYGGLRTKVDVMKSSIFRKTGSAIRPLSQAPAPVSSGLACDALVWASPLQVEPQFSGRLHRPVEYCSDLRRPKWLFLQPSSWACGQVFF
jgi:hypothetical protein